jgi:hypothetical protein
VEPAGGTMKIEIEDNSKPTFKPFTLKIDVESKEELALLWCLFNVTYHHIEGANGDKPQFLTARPVTGTGSGDPIFKLWETVNQAWKARQN